MIETFSVENYRSIKTKQTLSFIANRKIKSGSDEYLLAPVSDTVDLLKFCVIYGYNASGKTNLLLALDYLRDLIVDKSPKDDTGFIPFAFSEQTRSEPGKFTLNFYIDKIRYSYHVMATHEKILHEELTFQPKGRRALLYRRDYDDMEQVSKLTFGAQCDLRTQEKATLIGNTIAPITTLLAYQKSNIHSSELEKVVEYFLTTMFPIVMPKSPLRRWNKNRLINDESIKQFHIDLLQRADFQIEDIKVQKDSLPVDDTLVEEFRAQGAPESVIEQIQKEKKLELTDLLFMHRTQEGLHHLPFDDESEGTLRYFGLGGIMHSLLSSGGIAIIDELESSLHPELVAFLLQMFFLNSENAQILATTHNQNIMELDYMRNDMIWLCEKNMSGASEYYSAQDFGLHKKVNLANAYRAGKLGATPYLGNAALGEVEK